MGGLAGFPFVGKTGFGAYMHHVPEGGCMLIICASHVGVDPAGTVGKVHRHGMKDESSACGAAVGAYSFCEAHKDQVEKIAEGDAGVYPAFNDKLDMQQNHIQKVIFSTFATLRILSLFSQFVASKFNEISQAPNAMTALALACSHRIREELEIIIPPELHFPLFIVQGVQINFEGKEAGEDYFYPISFSLREKETASDLKHVFE